MSSKPQNLSHTHQGMPYPAATQTTRKVTLLSFVAFAHLALYSRRGERSIAPLYLKCNDSTNRGLHKRRCGGGSGIDINLINAILSQMHVSPKNPAIHIWGPVLDIYFEERARFPGQRTDWDTALPPSVMWAGRRSDYLCQGFMALPM